MRSKNIMVSWASGNGSNPFHDNWNFEHCSARDAGPPAELRTSLIGCYAGIEASSSQKRLPLPGVESTPTLPFMRSTALRTMARPTPVP